MVEIAFDDEKIIIAFSSKGLYYDKASQKETLFSLLIYAVILSRSLTLQ